MTAQELVNHLQQQDVRLAAHGDRLRIDAPRGVLTPDLRRDLQERKPELLALIRERSPRAMPTPTEVEAMSLEQFAKAGLILHVRAAGLGELLFVSDDVPDSVLEDDRLPIYRAHELRKLAVLRPRPHSLKTIHEVKTIFQGTIEGISHE